MDELTLLYTQLVALYRDGAGRADHQEHWIVNDITEDLAVLLGPDGADDYTLGAMVSADLD
jgi:hypothetical protein